MAYYHSTPTANRASILAHGLLRSKSYAAQCGGYGVLFFAAKAIAQEGIDLWAVDLTGLEIEIDDTGGEPDQDDEWFAVYEADVEPGRIRLEAEAATAKAQEV